MAEEQHLRKHRWKAETREIDETFRQLGMVAIVDYEEGGLWMFPSVKCPKALAMRLSVNGHKLGRDLCKDLMAEAGFNPNHFDDA